jgi:2,4'-dihydroxyacetophenone dioxygenase
VQGPEKLHVYGDENSEHTGSADVFAKFDMCAAHHEKVGPGSNSVKQFVL